MEQVRIAFKKYCCVRCRSVVSIYHGGYGTPDGMSCVRCAKVTDRVVDEQKLASIAGVSVKYFRAKRNKIKGVAKI